MKTQVEIFLTPDQLAQMFVNWGSDEQAQFLNLVGKHFRSVDWDAEMQACSMVQDIDNNGSAFIYTTANFLKSRGMINSPKFRQLIHTYPDDSLYK